jgi:hypothetical protein
MLNSNYEVAIDLTGYEQNATPSYLEGCASLVIDRRAKVAYCTYSNRTHKKPAQTWAKLLGYQLVEFTATNIRRQPVLHTNTMLSICENFGMVSNDARSQEPVID